MEEVEAGRVEAIIIKNMSRLGRDYLKVGQIMEILRIKGVRLIAINDGVDSINGDDDFTPFRNIMNEYHARDTSKKIKSVFKAKDMSGTHLTGTVFYGYLWDEKREYWLVDKEAAAVVRQIFRLTMEGFGPYQISQLLKQQKVEIPSVHLARYGEGVNKNKTVKDIYGWGSSTIVNILKETTQEIEIYFNFVGKYVPPHFGEVVLTPEELESLRKKEERKDRLHQNYLKRKASGWQRE